MKRKKQTIKHLLFEIISTRNEHSPNWKKCITHRKFAEYAHVTMTLRRAEVNTI